MARVTVEDCLDHVDNRFQLVLVAAKRARQLVDGAEPCVARGHEKPTVLALREIAGGFITSDILQEHAAVEGYEADEDITQQFGAPAAAPESPAAPEAPAAGD